jgi:hypothetical protein
MGTRNFGMGSRDMEWAGDIALKTQSGLSFSGIATVSERWGEFCKWAQVEGIKKMENVTRETLIKYGNGLASKVLSGELSAATAQNYVSAANRVMEIARGDNAVSVSPTRDCGIPKRSGIATESRAIGEKEHAATQGRVSPRLGALTGLQREFGLRFKESCLLNARKALQEAKTLGHVRIVDGTKGGRARTVPIARPERQMAALERAAALQDGRSMVPADRRYIDFARACYRELGNHHGERHSYAQARYEALTGSPCPLAANVAHGAAHHRFLAGRLGVTAAQARGLDQQARLQIAEELGHGRIEITHKYLG